MPAHHRESAGSNRFARYAIPGLLWAFALALLCLALLRVLEADIDNNLLNSDALYLHLFAQDLLEGFPIRSWKPPPANCLFPDFLLVLLATSVVRVFGGAPIDIVVLSGGLMGLTWMLAYAWFFRVLLERIGIAQLSLRTRTLLNLAAPLGGSTVFAWIALGLDRRFLDFLLVPSFHATCVFMLPVCMGLSLKFFSGESYESSSPASDSPRRTRASFVFAFAFERPSLSRWMYLVGLGILVALMLASDRMFYVTALLPVLLTLPALGWKNLSGIGWYLATIALAVFVAGYIVRGLDRVLVLTPLALDWSRLSLAAFLDSLSHVDHLMELLGSFTFVPFYGSVLAFLFAARFAKTSAAFPARRLIAWLLLAHAAMFVLVASAMIAFGHLSTGAALILRYIAPAMAALPIPAVFCLILVLAEGSRTAESESARASVFDHTQRVMVRVVAFVVAVGLLVFMSQAIVSRPYFSAQKDPAMALYPSMQCIHDRRERMGRFGFSDYWTAKRLSFLSGGELVVNQLQRELDLMYWINNFERYYEPHRSGVGYSFIIENGLNRSRILANYGAPAEELQCGEYRFLIYSSARDQKLRWAFPPEVLDFLMQMLGRAG
ncbi:MAG: hypothetical protein NXI24_08545 [bacterium]|nr:hypothetical protein [bacterium]